MLTHVDTQAVVIPRVAYSLSEAELATGLSRSTLYRLMARGELGTVKRGKRRLIPTQELQRLCQPEAAPA
jgi:excisionase family DNA binding protein